jgi:hypothetical protein
MFHGPVGAIARRVAVVVNRPDPEPFLWIALVFVDNVSMNTDPAIPSHVVEIACLLTGDPGVSALSPALEPMMFRERKLAIAPLFKALHRGGCATLLTMCRPNLATQYRLPALLTVRCPDGRNMVIAQTLVVVASSLAPEQL